MARLGPSAPQAALSVRAEVSAARRHLDRLTQLRLVIARLTAPASVATRRDDAPSRGPGGNSAASATPANT